MASKLALKYWEDDIEPLAESTKQAYRFYFNKFLENVGLTAEELYTLHYNTKDSVDERDQNEVEKLLRGYLRKMKEEGLANGTQRNVVKAVTSFMKANFPKSGFKLRKRDTPRAIYQGQDMAVKDEIKKMILKAGTEHQLRNKALILFMKDSGLRVSDVSKLNVEHYKSTQDYKSFKVFKKFKTQKTKDFANIIIGPESINAIDAYLEDREKRAGELYNTPGRETQHMRFPEFDKSQPLFMGRYGKRLTRKGLSSIFQKFKKSLEGNGEKISAHSLRKFHYTQLNPMGEGYVKLLEGKATDAYVKRPSDLWDRYIKYYWRLELFNEDQARKEQQKQIDTLKAQLEDVREKTEFLEKIPVEALEMIAQSYRNGSLVNIGVRRRDEPKSLGSSSEVIAINEKSMHALQASGWEAVEELENGQYRMRPRE